MAYEGLSIAELKASRWTKPKMEYCQAEVVIQTVNKGYNHNIDDWGQLIKVFW